MKRLVVAFALCVFVSHQIQSAPQASKGADKESKKMRLGNFSVSLTVKDLKASREFYEKLGFQVVSGDGKKWSVLKNENTKIGLFQGLFDKNILTFNPGWDSDKKILSDFDDVREIQKQLISKGIALTTKADESSTGPAHFTLTDPDGNQILFDQHVPKPAK